MFHCQILPLLPLKPAHILHNGVLGLRFRLWCLHDQVLLPDNDLFWAAALTEFSTAFGPCEELCEFALGCKSNDQFQLNSNMKLSSPLKLINGVSSSLNEETGKGPMFASEHEHFHLQFRQSNHIFSKITKIGVSKFDSDTVNCATKKVTGLRMHNNVF